MHDLKHIDIEYGCYTACSTSEFNNPIWQIKAEKTKIDKNKETISYKNARFEVFGIPVLFTPYFSHLTPQAMHKGRSGILMPYFNTNEAKIPLYFRIKPNMDLTIAPRLMRSGVITEGEFRHKTQTGNYVLNGSALPYNQITIKTPNDSTWHTKTLTRYHLAGNGNFKWHNITTGFVIQDTSDPAYIKEYYDIFDPYLVSKGYLNHINYDDYLSAQGIYFQDMRQADYMEKSFAIPMLRGKKTFHLDLCDIEIDSDNMFYHSNNNDTNEVNTKNNPFKTIRDRIKSELKNNNRIPISYTALRSSNIINVHKSHQIYNHYFETNLYNKIDLYRYNYLLTLQTNADKTHSLIKHLPEMHFTWKYPVILGDVLIEPTAMVSQSLAKPNQSNIILIDSEQMFETNELNLIYNNRFSGRDMDEMGRRISYGINIEKMFLNSTYSAFLGSYHNDNISNNIVGKLSFTNHSTDFYYRFNLTNNLTIKMQEIGLDYKGDKIKISTTLFEANKTSDQNIDLAEYNMDIANLNAGISYQIDDKWLVHFGTLIDLIGPPSILTRVLGVTYTYDCVTISAKIAENFTKDATRNIYNPSAEGFFSIGLKTLINM